MGTIEEVTEMKESGKPDSEIIQYLKENGLSSREISTVMNESQIKGAVTGQEDHHEENGNLLNAENYQYNQRENMESIKVSNNQPVTQEYQDMQPSIMNQQQESQENQYPEQYSQEYSSQEQYPSYQPSGLSSDTVTEIAEQIATEKIFNLKNQIEKIISSKSLTEAKIESIDERLKRLERIIDRLQLSILQKVGDYVNNVEDIKREVIETQKSFKSLLSKNRK